MTGFDGKICNSSRVLRNQSAAGRIESKMASVAKFSLKDGTGENGDNRERPSPFPLFAPVQIYKNFPARRS
jgi:hypothetical protein